MNYQFSTGWYVSLPNQSMVLELRLLHHNPTSTDFEEGGLKLAIAVAMWGRFQRFKICLKVRTLLFQTGFESLETTPYRESCDQLKFALFKLGRNQISSTPPARSSLRTEIFRALYLSMN